jgi:hydroxymethylglutaryl-CoA lyase
MFKIIECPRDAMQGIKHFIPTEVKVNYHNLLLQVGFDTLDFGSFVSPKAIPQMRDTAEVLNGLDLSKTDTKLLGIIANKRGAVDACAFEEITYLGFPFSVSETFQQRNTNASLSEAIERVHDVQDIAVANDKTLVVYLSMGFGNPYGDIWNAEIVLRWVEKLYDMGVRILALSDTIGVATPESIGYIFENVIPEYPDVEFGAHLHTTYDGWEDKVRAAYESGCRRMDGAIKGYGGCPMAKDDLTGNMPTEHIIRYLEKAGIGHGLDKQAFKRATDFTSKVFL